MSTRKTLQQYRLLNSVTMSSTSYIQSAPFNIQYFDNVSLQFTWHGTPTGTLSISASTDHQEDIQTNVINVGNFVPLSVTFGSQPSGSSGSILINLNQQPYAFLKANYLPSSSNASSGVLDVWVGAKVI